MQKNLEEHLMLISVIVNRGLGSKVLQTAKKSGVSGGTVVLGNGTFENRVLKALGLNDTYKEIVLIVTTAAVGFPLMEMLNEKFKLSKPHHGIAFSTIVDSVLGSMDIPYEPVNTVEGEKKTMYQSVYVIVEKGRGELAVESACKAGAGGATIINARGAGAHETSRLFNMEIEPEKEVVLIILKSELTQGVLSSLRDALEIDKPGNGIIFVQSLNQVYGLYE